MFSGNANEDVGYFLLMFKPRRETREVKAKFYHRLSQPLFIQNISKEYLREPMLAFVRYVRANEVVSDFLDINDLDIKYQFYYCHCSVYDMKESLIGIPSLSVLVRIKSIKHLLITRSGPPGGLIV